ncbi:MAG: pirin family protein [Cocleimonas sp.]
MSNIREIKQIITGRKTSDGDGVSLTRVIGTADLDILDPFLLLDAFGSDKPLDYIGGFPAHPHRGFETVTYMLAGKMRHKDSAGNEGIIEKGGVQWMSAGKGIIHSEMPEQEEGLLAGFQLWVNLPAAHKMDQPRYQEFNQSEVPVELRANTCRLNVIAGETMMATKGVIDNDFVDPIYWDIHLSSATEFIDKIPQDHNAFIYMIEGDATIGKENKQLEAKQLAVLSLAENIKINANSDCRFLLIAGKPLNESVAKGGPFVMNTQAEIDQAYVDYQTGHFA